MLTWLGQLILLAEWGVGGNFPQLHSLNLGFAVISAGAQLPSQWGTSGGFASLQSLTLGGLGGTAAFCTD